MYVFSIPMSVLQGQGLNPLLRMPISGSSDSAANKDMMSKIWTNGDTIA